LPEIISAEVIFCFISFADEVDTHILIQQLQRQNKTIVVPKTSRSRGMIAIALASWQELERDGFGILVPRTSVAYPGSIDVSLTPGLGFSPSGARLGYGRGYYDAWFTAHPAVYKIGVAYECQVLDHIPMGERDVAVDKLVTEARVCMTHPGNQP
jgi:5-formyltetrahydrofolate cyclo-ligase